MQLFKRTLLLLCLSGLLSLCASPGVAHQGLASYYDMPGAQTASGYVLNESSWTAAHRTFGFGSELTVCYGNTCIHNVEVLDRGPYVGGRVLDLHSAPAASLGLTSVGVDYVSYWREIPGHWDGVYVSGRGVRWLEY